MKKVLFLIVSVFVFSNTTFAEKEPRFHVVMKEGQVVRDLNTNESYVGYENVKQSQAGILWWKRTNVRCTKPGKEKCRATVDGNTYYFTISDPTNNNSYDFDSRMIVNIVNDLLVDTEELCFNSKESTGGLSVQASLYDKQNVQHVISFRSVYNMESASDGVISVYIDIIR
ncbi:MAG: hypothetical protein U0L93_02555 [Bacteroidales bacterium]|nr:hypothetical protein [Bacteroidales bacterium]MEE1252010.1 hypothetical protein [Bacteroidales bacterium]